MIQPVREGAAGDAALVAAALAGDGLAFSSLFDGWFDRCFDVAFRIVRNRDVAAEVAQEVFLGAWRDLASLRDHTAFGGWVLRSSRNRALNRLEKERRTVALGDEVTTTAADAAAPVPDAAAEALAGAGADLVWAAATALGERDASILDLHLRHGMAAPELAEALGVTPNNAHQLLFRLRGRLGDAIRSFVLWHEGRPSCPELQDVLHRAGLSAFGPDAAKLAQRHADRCQRCGERQRSALAPEALFAGVPLVVAGSQLRAKVISSLRDAGVPVGQPPPASTPPPPPPGGPLLPGAPAAESDGGAGRARWAGRRSAVAAAVLAALLVAGGAVLARRADRRSSLLEATALDTLSSGGPTTLAPIGTSPSTTAGPVVGATGPGPTSPGSTVAPTTAPSSSPPPTSAVTSTSTSSPTTVARAPGIQRFTATLAAPSRLCPNEQLVQLAWSTTGATAAALTGPGAPTRAQSPSGTATACAPASVASPVYVLTATGPGGDASAKDAA